MPVGKATKKTKSVFSYHRDQKLSRIEIPKGLKLNTPVKMDGIKFLNKLPEASSPVAFFDPQYRGVLDKMSYGNEGESRGKSRAALAQMDVETIKDFIANISRVLIESGHLFLWVDKFHLCTDLTSWHEDTDLSLVDLITWKKLGRFGMGYRTRRQSEHLAVLQKEPRRAKGVWTSHDIPDVLEEQVKLSQGTHRKPVGIQARLIEAVSNERDLVIDPAAGTYSVLDACKQVNRDFLGCDLNR